MTQNQPFKLLLDEGVRTTAARQGKSLEAVEMELAEKTEYSRATVHHWRRGNPPPEQETLAQIVVYCVHHGRLPITWARRMLVQGGYFQPERLLAELFKEESTGRKRIFICYARDSKQDQALALAQELSHEYLVFFDQPAQMEGWAQTIKHELMACDFFIVFLSPEAVANEVVLTELEIAGQLNQERGQPTLLPILIQYSDQIVRQIPPSLENIPAFMWKPEDDLSSLMTPLQAALIHGRFSPQPTSPATIPSTSGYMPTPSPAARPFRLEVPEGAIDLESTLYIERPGDRIALKAIAQQGVTITIKGPRQMGKSSLLIRIAEAARKRGKKTVFLDFQLLSATLQDAAQFFRQFCALLSHQLELPDKTESYWQTPITNAFRCTHYLRQEVLGHLDTPILLALDEVDGIFETSFRTDFFGMLRSWHNNRARDPHFKKLDMALVTSTEPYYFVQSLSQSPFNVGEIIDLADFTPEQVAELNERHRFPFSPTALTELMILLQGHPYLVRRALYLVADQRITSTDLLAQATEAYGPFGDHLRSLFLRLHHNQMLLQSLHQALQTGACSDEQFFRLHGAGLVVRKDHRIVPRCPLYAEFFQQQLSHVRP